MTFSHDSTRLASASHDGTVKIWDASSGECLRTLAGHRSHSSLQSLAFSHDSTRLASAWRDGTVNIWDASSDEWPRTFIIWGTSYNISFEPTGSYLYTDSGEIILVASSSSLDAITGTANSVSPSGAFACLMKLNKCSSRSSATGLYSRDA